MPENLLLTSLHPDSSDNLPFRHFHYTGAPMFIMDHEGRLLDAHGLFCNEPLTESSLSLHSGNEQRYSAQRWPEKFIDIDTRKRKANEVYTLGKATSFTINEHEIVWKYSISPLYACDRTIGNFLLTVEENPIETGSLPQKHNTLAAVTELYNAIPASIIFVDASMQLVGWNRFSRDTINGLSDHEMSGVNPLKRVHPDDFAEISRKVRRIIDCDVEETAEFRMFHKTGPPYKWATFRGKRAIIENKPCMIAVVTEITEIREAKEKQQKLEAQLLQYQKMEMVGQLAGGIAHDFNNALAAIIGNTELVLGKLDPESPFASNISDIHKLALRSAEMTRKLLAFARKQEAIPELIDLDEAVSEYIRLHQSLFDEHITIEWHSCEETQPVIIDPMQLDQILSNLLINARDAISGNGHIRVDCRHVHFNPADCKNERSGLTPGDYTLLSVSDTGSGIDETVLPHIYEPFFTTKEIGKGTGLGLSTVYGIVMQNHGHIECQSKPGKGTTFEIWLPAHREYPRKSEPLKAPGNTTNMKETIMVVEDEPYILKLIGDILENHDFTVLAARDAEECLQTAAAHDYRIDLLLSDVVLPTMNGIEMSRLLQKKNPAMKLLFMSAHAPDHHSRKRKLKAGVDFIQKPFGIDDFLDAIYRVLHSTSEKSSKQPVR